MIVRDPSVQQELELTGEQLSRVNAAIARVDEPLWVLRDTPLDQSGEKLDALLEQLRQGVKDALTEKQWSRLEQILLQARGFKALRSPDLQSLLDLTDDQVMRIQSIVDGNARVTANTNDKEKRAKNESKPLDQRSLLVVLSEEQQKKLADLVGSPFDLSKVLEIGCVAPDFRTVEAWINGGPYTRDSLRGKVTVIHFWTFGCINCIHNLPHYEAWREKYSSHEVAIIGFHTPETEAERSIDNVRRSIQEKGIKWTVAIDSEAANWKAWGNHTWPSVYLVDKQGRVRNWWYGELNWKGAKGEEFLRKKIDALLKEK
jgi:thiol-disulfide isomerase/thioredoxin